MKLSRCPVCHSHIDLLALVEDEAGRDLLKQVAGFEAWLSPPLLSYIALFKPAKSDLNNARSLKLLQDVLALHPNRKLLALACDVTVQQIRLSRQTGSAKPLRDHNYLKSVIDSKKSEFTNSVQPTAAMPTAIVPNTDSVSADELARQQKAHFDQFKKNS